MIVCEVHMGMSSEAAAARGGSVQAFSTSLYVLGRYRMRA